LKFAEKQLRFLLSSPFDVTVSVLEHVDQPRPVGAALIHVSRGQMFPTAHDFAAEKMKGILVLMRHKRFLM